MSISEKQVRRSNSLVKAVLTLGPQVWILMSAVVISSLLGMVFVSSPPSALLSTMIVGGAAGIGAMVYSIVRFERFVLVLLAIRPLMDAFNLGGQGGVLTPSVAIGVAFEISAVFWLWRRWRDMQPDPDEVDPAMGASDPDATVTAAQKAAYQLAENIRWDRIYFRTDIGHRAIARETTDKGL